MREIERARRRYARCYARMSAYDARTITLMRRLRVLDGALMRARCASAEQRQAMRVLRSGARLLIRAYLRRAQMMLLRIAARCAC